MGQIYEKLKPHLADDSLGLMIEHALVTRNALVHKFFVKRQAGLAPTSSEIADAIRWCEAAGVQFKELSRRLEDRWAQLQYQLSLDPDGALPGPQDRQAAAERGEWAWS